jgi:hypothetical protein
VDYINNPHGLLDEGQGLNQFATCWWSRSTLTISGLRPSGAGRE